MIDSSIYTMLKRQAEATPDRVAIAASDHPDLTYQQLYQLCQQVIEQLNSLGIGRNDRVAIVLPNGPEMATTFLSVAAGATSAPLNPAYRAQEYDFYLTDLDAKALILLAGENSPAAQVAQDRNIPIIRLTPLLDDAAGLFTLSGETKGDVKQGGPSQTDDVALVLHTSGTTSRPKIVPLTQGNLCTSAYNIGQTLRLTEADRCLNVMPLFHIHGLMAATLSSLTAGASVVCTPGFYAPSFFEWVATFQPSWYTAVPTMHQAILARTEGHKEIITQHPLRFIRSSSSSLPPQVMADLEAAFNAPVIESYGMTEAAHQMASNPLPPAIRKPGSVGVAAGPEVAIMAEAEDKFLSQGATGEIVIRGANVTLGYANNPEANSKSFPLGWFRTGDQGYLDTENYLYITGRLKEIINRGGEKISPREIDEVLLTHPEIVQALTFAVPHPKLGEMVAAAVILQDGSTTTALDIRRFAARTLTDFKVPEQVVILDEIPKGPTGKLQRIGLAEKLGLVDQATTESNPTEFVPPSTPKEELLTAVWQEVLGVKQVGIQDRFLDIGGDSVLATQLLTRVRQQLNLEIPLIDFFETPTISQQAALLEILEAEAPLNSEKRVNLSVEAGSDDTLVKSAVIQLQAGASNGQKSPFFCVHARGGQVFSY
ncbi:MAG: AMP-binding protein, partial [Chloroflexota bacterium]